MKQKFVIFIGVGVLIILVILSSLLTKKSLTSSPETIIQQISSSQYNPKSISNNNNELNKNVTIKNKSSSNSLSTSQILVSLTPSPTQSPLSSFTSALNVLYGNPNNQQTVVIPTISLPSINTTPSPTPDPLRNFITTLNILFSFSNTNPVITTPSPSSPFQPQNLSSPINSLSSNFVYYPQCNGPYDNDPLPNGCNICAAGCGITSVSMILSSYVDKKYDPPTVVNLYGQSGLQAGCKGTTIVDAQQILNQNGIKTTDINYYGDSSFDETVQDFKQYLNNGWTLLTLVKYSKDWGHFYWIVSVDENNNIWAYDPGDAKRPVPLNENTVEPTAKYYLAIGVKK